MKSIMFSLLLSFFLVSCVFDNSATNTHSFPLDSVSNLTSVNFGDTLSTDRYTKLSYDELLARRDSLLANYNDLHNFSVNESLETGDYSMGIKTFYLNDTLDEECGFDFLTMRPVIQKQELFFSYKDSITSNFILPINKILCKNQNKDEIYRLDADIWRMMVITGSKGSLFYVLGSGQCNGQLCPEFEGCYSLDGRILYQGYIGTNNDIRKVFEDYGVTDSLFKSAEKQSVRIDDFWY